MLCICEILSWKPGHLQKLTNNNPPPHPNTKKNHLLFSDTPSRPLIHLKISRQKNCIHKPVNHNKKTAEKTWGKARAKNNPIYGWKFIFDI